MSSRHDRCRGTRTAAVAVGFLFAAFAPAAGATNRRAPRPAGAKSGVSSSTTSTTSTTSTAPPTSPLPDTTAPATGPIRIMVTYRETVNDNTRKFLAGAQARIATVNAGGGVNGRRIEIVTCNNRFELAASQDCARRAVTEKVVAFLHAAGGAVAAPAGSPVPFASDSSVILPILASAGIPWAGNFLSPGAEEATSPIAYPFASIPVAFAGLAVAMVNQGCSRIAFVGGQFSREPFRRGMASKGRDVVFESNFPRSDPGSVIPALVARNVDCVFFGSVESEMLTFIDAVERSGASMRLAWLDGLISERSLARLGPSIDGAIVAANGKSIFDVSDPTVQQYRNEIDAFDRGVSYDQFGFAVWAGTDLVVQAMRSVKGDVTAATTLAALRGLKYNSSALGALDLTRELADPLYRRMFNTNAVTYKIVNAKYVKDSVLDLRALFDKPPA